MAKNNKSAADLITHVIIFAAGVLVGSVISIGICLSDKNNTAQDKEIEELKIENRVLKEENQDIMGLWSELVNE